MAALNFPTNPTDGQIFPDPPIPGTIQYIWSDSKGTWLTISQGVQQVRGEAPIQIKGTRQIPIVSIPAATRTQGGYMTAADKAKLDAISEGASQILPGTSISVSSPTGSGQVTISTLPAAGSRIGSVSAGAGLRTDDAGKMDLQPATSGELGGIKVGEGLTITPDGTLSSLGGPVVLRDISPGFNGSQTTFTLQRIDGLDYTPTSINNLLIFVSGMLQVPGYSYAISGSQLVFTQAPPAGALFYGLAIT